MKKNILFALIGFVFCTFLTPLAISQNFTNYSTTNGLADNYCMGGIAIDTNNHVWVGTAAGISTFDGATWTTYTTAQGLLNNTVNCIEVDHNNQVWAGSLTGVSKFNGTTFTTFTTADGLVDNNVKNIRCDQAGNVWFATDYGVSMYNGSTFTTYSTTQGLPTNIITFIAGDTLNNKWFATQLAGYSKYNNSVFSNTSTAQMDSLLDNNTFAVAVDRNLNTWIGTWMGITKVGPNGNWLTNYRAENGLYNNFVRDIEMDHLGRIWVGCFADYNLDGGISVFNGSYWLSYSTPQGLVDKQVIRLAIDKNNDIWVATGNGVSHMSSPNGIEASTHTSLLEVYPNPCSNRLLIKNAGKQNEFQIHNVSGKLLLQSQLDATSHEIDVSGLPQGVYLLSLYNGQEVFKQKLIKQ